MKNHIKIKHKNFFKRMDKLLSKYIKTLERVPVTITTTKNKSDKRL